VHLLGVGGVADGDLGGDGDAVLAVGERVPVVVDVVVGVLIGGPAEEAELVGRAEGGEAREGELPVAVAPGGGAVEEEVAEEVAVAGGRRRVDGDVVEAVRGREARPADLDPVVRQGEVRGEGGARGGRRACGEGRDGEEEEVVGVFGVHFAGDAVEKWLVTCPENLDDPQHTWSLTLRDPSASVANPEWSGGIFPSPSAASRGWVVNGGTHLNLQ